MQANVYSGDYDGKLGYTEKQIAELKAAAEACYFDLLRAEYEMEINKLQEQQERK